MLDSAYEHASKFEYALVAKLISAICWVKINDGASLFIANRHVFFTDAISTPASAPSILQHFCSGMTQMWRTQRKHLRERKKKNSMLCTRFHNPIRNATPQNYSQQKKARRKYCTCGNGSHLHNVPPAN